MTIAAGGGTGSSLARAIIIVTGVSALVSSLLSFVVPIYAVSSWTSIISLTAAQFLDPVRDIYEAFTIYTFFQLLINFLGGERAVIIMAHGRPPISHAWPLNHFLPKIDVSDPHTFLAVKRGILQYAWLKPILALASIIMKATDTYQEGYIGLSSGYLWTGIIYNVSVTISLYSLAMFWVCLHDDLMPFRPIPKFLCIKLIIFASYWQGFFLSILQWLGALGNVAGYTPDNLAAAIQDSLICFEMPFFAMAHWYAFSWHDYADPTISAARMPVKYALRDAFGVRDLVEDTKLTIRGKNYGYRLFDSGDNIIPHEESGSRVKRVMDGMSEIDETAMDDEDERLFLNARALEFGDWNYPVITANEVPRDQRLPPTRRNQDSSRGADVKKARRHRKSRASDAVSRQSPKPNSNKPGPSSATPGPLQRNISSTSSSGTQRSQLVDLVVENTEAEEEDRAQIQREYGTAWAEPEPRRFERPSGEPIEEEEANSTQPESNHDDDRPKWAYDGLEQDNVWGK
ncbi:Organic solute transporter Ost-alpha [Penicillium griseofulvum]|uniref:Organic solute transporter Ost-alpha n=1 Tax=Penicillium patulum TaxID=5078 RepID=A0A135LHB7_PENPA|nr:Organic solute transporter Ost-alpha [Penicillium griseofulvum]KXG48371.1 Organic solute transporter Ost-alpha [Penicillium griseofulvum]